MEITMKTEDGQVTKEQALATLDALDMTKKRAIASARPPNWLLYSAALLCAAFSSLSIVKDESALLFSLNVTAVLLFLGSFVYWLLRLRQMGVTMAIFPRSLSGNVFYLLQGIFYIAVLVVATMLYDRGMAFAPYLAGLINGGAFAYLTHKYPTGEWYARGARP
jgi:hypothetical protein